MQHFDHVPWKVLITGGSGTGKTTLAAKLVAEEKAHRKFAYDHDGQFSSRFGHKSIDSWTGLDEAVAKGGWIAYDPAQDIEDWGTDLTGGLDFFCSYVLKVSKTADGRKILYIDELDDLTGNREYMNSLASVMQTGRRYMIDCCFIAAQPNSLHNRIVSQFTEIYTFLHTHDAAIKFLDANGIPAEAIRNLGQHGYIHKNLRTGKIMSNIPAIDKALNAPSNAGLALPAPTPKQHEKPEKAEPVPKV